LHKRIHFNLLMKKSIIKSDDYNCRFMILILEFRKSEIVNQ
jgi:hypothetical protein